MYIPDINQWDNRAEIEQFIETYSFAQLITIIDGKAHATSLPFLMAYKNNQPFLISHLALANPQAAHIQDQEHLIIFQEPHAFIPEKLYDRRSVPTWNYLSVHIYGMGTVINDPNEIIAHLKRTTDHYEPDFWSRWPSLPQPTKRNLLAEVLCFTIDITDLQPKSKLSQNKNSAVRNRIKQHLSQSEDLGAQEISKYISG